MVFYPAVRSPRPFDNISSRLEIADGAGGGRTTRFSQTPRNTFLRRQLIGGIDGRLGAKRVSKVRFVIGTVQPRRAKPLPPPPPPEATAEQIHHAQQAAERDVPPMENEDLRAGIVEARVAQLLRESLK